MLAAACQQAEDPQRGQAPSMPMAKHSSEPQEQLQNFASGEISRRFYLVNGKKEGKMTDYFIDGKVRSERIFENDRQVGKTVFFYPSGKTKEVQYYEDGLKHGGDTTFYEDGRLQFVLPFQQGKQHGYVRKWAPDGSLTFEARYEMDTLVEVRGQKIRPDKKAMRPGPATHSN